MTNKEIIEQLENAIELIKQDGKDWLDDRDIPILRACIKSLTALDKMKAEIEDLTYYWCEVNPRTVIDEVLEIIDKYKKDGEI